MSDQGVGSGVLRGGDPDQVQAPDRDGSRRGARREQGREVAGGAGDEGRLFGDDFAAGLAKNVGCLRLANA